ncbi:peptidoglycan recognition protein family protein [Streptomyces rhizosphaerihabitans]|uniref:peptidoglycan recognition protein family protein n=1 Tax=Streptomyces rhizosphaerihabitans TaxID=1266770 RepID=UPI0021C0E447|nr:peptidoglycan recognition protein [Streptomyces rhizosphaerihabitans]MCT9003466.1 N-acetylmuramoyl-L-alanine amidase [Streptomyces rhizosphaerihabitans]
MKRRAWLTLGALVLGGGGVVTYAVASPSSDPGAARRAKRPAKVYDLALKGGTGDKRELPRTDTEQFSMLGVSWTGAAKRLDGTAQVRTRSIETGRWSAWQDLELNVDPLENPGAGVRGASEPLWVGPSDGMQAQVLRKNGAGSSALPKGLEVNLVDPGVITDAETKAGSTAAEKAAFVADESPGATASAPTDGTTDGTTATPTDGQTATSPAATDTTPAATDFVPPSASESPADSVPPSPSTSSSAPPSAPPSTVPEPPIVSRADWGADESISPEAPEYNADVKAVFVHHTDGANDYSCADSPSIIRSIYAYHVQVSGWKDIGYNFLVDKCGTVFEGRKGGVDLPVFGAHTYGWNRESAGIAVLGDYTTTSATNATLASVARLAAWKLGQYGADPAGTTQVTAGADQHNYFNTNFTAGGKYTFQRISGHRDGYNTQCPGGLLYDQLPTIRTWASGPVQGLKVSSVDGAGLSGSTYYTKGGITVRWTATTPASLISKFELLVDGKSVATTSGTATSAGATLALGSHTVAVRAVHQSGRTATTAALTVVAETTAPTFTTNPKVSLGSGTVSTSAVPVALGWKATDDKALREVRLLSPTTATFGPTTASSNRTARSGTATTWSMRAYDYAGNYLTSSPSYTPVILQETAAAKSGSWTTRSSTSYLGGQSYSSGSKGAGLTWTFTGRSAAWVVSRAAGSGQAYVYADGTKISTVDLKSSTSLYRQAIWTKTWSSSAKHTIKIVVVGTSGRPTVTTDGLVYIK